MGEAAFVSGERPCIVASVVVSAIIVLALVWLSTAPTRSEPMTPVIRGRDAGAGGHGIDGVVVDLFGTTGRAEERRGSQHEVWNQDTAAPIRIVGRVAYETGVGAPQVDVELFAAASDASRGSRIRSQVTRNDGSFRFDVGTGCYSVIVVAPGAERIVGSGRVASRELCLAVDTSPAVVHISLEGERPPGSTLSTIELELLRLTNLLRAEPGGQLRRQRDLPPCVDDPIYRITIDPSTGLPEPAPPLEMSETAANAIARSWAIEMALSGAFRHRPTAAQQQLLTSLGLPVTAWGENIAWFSGYPSARTAETHFEGWRESETNHYCALLAPRFTHVGIGELRMGDESWAVQNFYTTADSELAD